MAEPIDVVNVNHPPVFEPVENQTVARGELREVLVRATDADLNSLSLTAVDDSDGEPLPALFDFVDHGDGTGTLSIAPSFNDRRSSGITSPKSTPIIRPKPLQLAQAPIGELKENKPGVGSL